MGLLEVLKSLADLKQWDYSDRRGNLRIPCQLEACLSKGKTKVDVEVIDISLVGIRVLILGKVRKGSIMELLPRGGSKKSGLKCKIEWKSEHERGWLAGVSFQETEKTMSKSWLFEELVAIGDEAVKTQQRREGIRVLCDAQVKLRYDDEIRTAQLVDLGYGGALLESEGEELTPGQKLRLDLGPIEDLCRIVLNCEVVVVHQRDPVRYGLKFETFYIGGITDVERYLDHFYEQHSQEE